MINLNIDLKDGKYFIESYNGIVKLYDLKDNKLYQKDYVGWEEWVEYDANRNCIHRKYSNGREFWYDDKGNAISKEKYDRIHSSCHGKIVEVDGKKYQLKEIK